jgi:hypothetical protein
MQRVFLCFRQDTVIGDLCWGYDHCQHGHQLMGASCPGHELEVGPLGRLRIFYGEEKRTLPHSYRGCGSRQG